MGSGAVGVEFASIFRSYGSEVTLIELLPKLVPAEDEAVSTELERTFKKRGIKSLTGTRVTSAKATEGGVDLTMDRGGKSESLRVEMLLVATGRGPVTDGLGVETIGLTMDRGYVVVDPLFAHERARHLGDRRRHHDGRPALPARARVVDGGHPAGRADCRPRGCAPSTTITCRAAPTPSRRSAASA